MVVVLLKLGHDNGSQVPLIVDAKARVHKLAVVRGEDVAGWRSDHNLRDTLIPCIVGQQRLTMKARSLAL